MAEAARLENARLLVDGSTITGPAYITLLLTAGSDAASLTLTVGSSALVLKAAANSSQELHSCIKIGNGVSATVALAGTSPTAYAFDEID